MHASALGVGKLVTFAGDTEDSRRIMRAADAGWIVAGGDNAAFSCLDFMALRLPVIAERSPLTGHYIADGISGLLLPSGDAADAAATLTAFLASSERLSAMGNAGRARLHREFPEGRMVEAWERAVLAAGDRSQWLKRK
jgi:glycosyltransferase involved in cell wall biosynthesis